MRDWDTYTQTVHASPEKQIKHLIACLKVQSKTIADQDLYIQTLQLEKGINDWELAKHINSILEIKKKLEKGELKPKNKKLFFFWRKK